MNEKVSLEKLLDLAGDHARAVMIGLQHELLPMWSIIDAKGELLVRATPWQNEHEKHLAEIFIRAEIAKRNAVAYSLVIEAWEAWQPLGWDPQKEPLTERNRPSKRVDRREVVIALAVDKERTVWRKWWTRRDWNDQVVALELAEELPGEKQSWMADLFKATK